MTKHKCHGRHRVKPQGQLTAARTPYGHKVEEFPQRHFFRKCQCPVSWHGQLLQRKVTTGPAPLSSPKPRGCPHPIFQPSPRKGCWAVIPLGLPLPWEKQCSSPTPCCAPAACYQFHKYFFEPMLCAQSPCHLSPSPWTKASLFRTPSGT